ncbi:hypothetical protein NECID01_1068 [Nematocida sp. AWRm77]|nr:hypothetical protein NECID01_1068 [Nematocida sp. AWRm77]
MTISSSEYQNMLVILGMEQLSEKEAREELCKAACGTYITEENSKKKDGVMVCRLEESGLLNALAQRLHGHAVRGEKLVALSLDKYTALHRIAQKTLGAEETNKPAVRKITSQQEIQEWKKTVEGEQFVIYNENKLVNYQATRMFLCKSTKEKPMANSKISVEGEFIVAQRQKNLFVYGGNLDLLDAFVKDSLVSYKIYKNLISIVTKIEGGRHLCEVFDLYTKEKIKHLEHLEEEKVGFSLNMTHYLVQKADRVEVRSFSTDEEVFAEHTSTGPGEGEKTEGFLSAHNNVAAIAKVCSVGTKFVLLDLNTGEEIRTKMFTNTFSFSVEFYRNEVSITNTRVIEKKTQWFVDVWDVSGESVLSKALGEGVKGIHIGETMVIVLSSSCAKVFKRVQGRLLESSSISGGFNLVAVNTVSALADGARLVFINKNGDILHETDIERITQIEWSPLGMYLALVDAGQVRILDLTGKEIYGGNVANENSFFWRPLFEAPSETSLSQEAIQRFKEEDAIRKKEAKQQFLEENNEMVSEWATFLHRMRNLYIASK